MTKILWDLEFWSLEFIWDLVLGIWNFSFMDGILRCSRYSFGPNRLHYCGPDANQEMFAYIKEGRSDFGLEVILQKFKTLHPYLRFIAHSNNIRDPFDERVVEAYWLGGELLDSITSRALYRHLFYDHRLKDHMGSREFDRLAKKIGEGAMPHHSFHVFNIWKRTGHIPIDHTLETMDACRISCGSVVAVDGPYITVETEPLVMMGGKLALGSPIQKRVARDLGEPLEFDELKVGDLITMHWGVPCEVITEVQAQWLRHYTWQSIRLANL